MWWAAYEPTSTLASWGWSLSRAAQSCLLRPLLPVFCCVWLVVTNVPAAAALQAMSAMLQKHCKEGQRLLAAIVFCGGLLLLCAHSNYFLVQQPRG
jgi:uncharacterized membrane protein YphA (DoxX/SURF4 family)